jgi:ribosomal protein S18 acetylase RimI-like enzyme
MIIRAATEADAADLARLMVLFDNPPRTPEQQAEMLRTSAAHDHVFIACVDSLPVGFIVLRHMALSAIPPNDVYVEVSDLFVEEAYRKRGIGRALMQHAEAFARERGTSGIWLITGFENEAAQSLYRAMGLGDWALAMRKVF